MDYEEMESELESAGIDPFEFSLMDEDERRNALEDALLDPWDFEDFDLEYSGGYTYSSPSVPVTPNVPKPPVTHASPVIKPPATTPSTPEKTNVFTVTPRPAAGPSAPVSEDTIQRQRRRAEIEAIDRKMHQLRNMIIILASLLVIIVVAGISTANRSPGVSVPFYTIEPTTSVVPYTTPTPQPTPRTTPTPMPSVPYVGMYVSYVPSKWTWQGTDNLTVKDAAGNGIRTIKYRYDAPPKIYVIWVSESTNNVVKVSVTDPTASSNRKSTTNKKSTSDPYQAKDYAHPDDFYYDYRDDFWDYEDAEDYWERHH